MPPQVGVGGCTPRPRNERADSITITRAMSRVATTSHGVKVFGSTGVASTRQWGWAGQPAPVAAAERHRGVHVLALADREHLAPHHPRIDHPGRYPDDDDDVAQA